MASTTEASPHSFGSLILSKEQRNVLDQVRRLPQDDESSCSQIVRVTSAAGTGKTTTLLALAHRSISIGHKSITYLTFNRTAAQDGNRRLRQVLSSSASVDARTLHSAAMTLLDKHRSDSKNGQQIEDHEDPEDALSSDDAVEAEIERICQRQIEEYLQPCFREIAHIVSKFKKHQETNRREMENRARKKVIFFIMKTLTQFCRSSLSYQEWIVSDRRDYFPAKTYHQLDGSGTKAGFVFPHYFNNRSFYTTEAVQLWKSLAHIRTFDMEMKRAQLKALEIPGSILLVDECQDMDACQIDWVTQQAKNFPNKQVFLVGDAAQTIYSFRGAKSTFLMNLEGCEKASLCDCTLTTSWRFGPAIASMANLVLFAKEKSPQTTDNYKPTWRPYRVTGGGKEHGTVTSRPIAHEWKTKKITLIAVLNATLLMVAIGLLGMPLSEEEEQGDSQGDVEEEGATVAIPVESDTKPEAAELPALDLGNMPKIHINGRGENSGLKKWNQVIKQIGQLFELFMSPEEIKLPSREFPEFTNEFLSWGSFRSEVEDKELNKYVTSISVVEKFRENTMMAIDLFKKQVMEKKYSPEESDIILSTCHAAKGMEWENVQLCDDFNSLLPLRDDGPVVKRNPRQKTKFMNFKQLKELRKNKKHKIYRPTWQFDFKSWGDDVNLLYVGCTRAKKTLSIPPRLRGFMQDCDLMTDFMMAARNNRKKSPSAAAATFNLFGIKKAISLVDCGHIVLDLLIPLRKPKEGIVLDTTKSKLCDAILNGDQDEEEDLASQREEIDLTKEDCNKRLAGTPEKGESSKKQKVAVNEVSP